MKYYLAEKKLNSLYIKRNEQDRKIDSLKVENEFIVYSNEALDKSIEFREKLRNKLKIALITLNKKKLLGFLRLFNLMLIPLICVLLVSVLLPASSLKPLLAIMGLLEFAAMPLSIGISFKDYYCDKDFLKKYKLQDIENSLNSDYEKERKNQEIYKINCDKIRELESKKHEIDEIIGKILSEVFNGENILNNAIKLESSIYENAAVEPKYIQKIKTRQ